MTELMMDVKRHEFFVGKKEVRLTQTQWNIVRVLLEANGATVDRGVICDKIWPNETAAGVFEPTNINIHIARIRQLIGKDGHSVIETIPGFGYRIKRAKLK